MVMQPVKSRFAILALLVVLPPTFGHAQTLNLVTEEAFPFQYLENKVLKGLAVEVVAETFKRANLSHKDEVLPWKAAYERAQIYPKPDEPEPNRGYD